MNTCCAADLSIFYDSVYFLHLHALPSYCWDLTSIGFATSYSFTLFHWRQGESQLPGLVAGGLPATSTGAYCFSSQCPLQPS